MYDRQRWCESATSVTMAHTKGDVLSVADQEYQMLTTVRSVLCRRRIVTAVRRLSIWAAPKLISSTSGRNTGSRKDDIYIKS